MFRRKIVFGLLFTFLLTASVFVIRWCITRDLRVVLSFTSKKAETPQKQKGVIMEDIRQRRDSLNPRYPSFGEFIRGLFEDGHTAKEIGGRILSKGRPIIEETVNTWASNQPPGKQLYVTIRDVLGYDFREYAFCVVASANHFPPEDSAPEIKAIRSASDLRAYLTKMLKIVKITTITEACELSSVSILSDLLRGKGLSEGSLEKVLRLVAILPRHVSGEILSPLTPLPLIARVLQECRLKSGMDRQRYAKRLDIGRGYIAFLESKVDQPESVDGKVGYSQDPQRLKRLCKILMAQCVRLGSAGDVGVFAEHEESDSEDRAAAPAAKEELELRVAKLERITTALVERISNLEAGASRPVAPGAVEQYRAPFGEGEWIEHDVPIDDVRLRNVRRLIEALCDELGFLARMRDKKARARIRETLRDQLTVELLGALEAFTSDEPCATKNIIESWRRAAKLDLVKTKGEKT